MNITRTAVAWALAPAWLALGACHDAPVTPSATATASPAVSESRAHESTAPLAVAESAGLEGLRDALVRIQHALEPDDRATAIAAGLRQAIAALDRGDSAGLRGSLRGLESTLRRYTSRDHAMAPDLDAIRLAIDAAVPR